MGVQNFIPELWSAKILKELDKEHMLVKNCTTEYSGEISGVGSRVKINSINSPTISDYTPGNLVAAETLKDESRWLEITQAKSFNIYIDDIDTKQTNAKVLEEAMRKAAVGLKDTAEVFIASKFVEAENKVTNTALTSANFFSTIMKAKRYLMKNNVKDFSNVVLEVNPEVFEKGVLADIVYNQQDNGDMIRNGVYSQRLGMRVFVTNSIATTVTSEDVVQATCVMRTKEAIAYAEQIMKMEKYRPHDGFEDAVKGLHVYGAKMIKPREAVALDLKTAAETTI